MKNQKLQKEELQKLNDFTEKRNQIVLNLGQIDVQKTILKGQRSAILESLAKLQEEENAMGRELQDKYGDGNIDLNTGEFTKSE